MVINLRAIEESDLPQLRDWRNDNQLRHGFREYRLLNMINQRDWFDHVSRSREVEMFGVLEGGVLVGVCGLCNINWVNRTAELSRYVAPDYQDRGLEAVILEFLLQKAFGEFNLRRLWAETYGFNAENITTLKQAGFVLEGTLRKHVFKLGKYHDSRIYGLLREELC